MRLVALMRAHTWGPLTPCAHSKFPSLACRDAESARWTPRDAGRGRNRRQAGILPTNLPSPPAMDLLVSSPDIAHSQAKVDPEEEKKKRFSFAVGWPNTQRAGVWYLLFEGFTVERFRPGKEEEILVCGRFCVLC